MTPHDVEVIDLLNRFEALGWKIALIKVGSDLILQGPACGPTDVHALKSFLAKVIMMELEDQP